jgi:hypothetical protein
VVGKGHKIVLVLVLVLVLVPPAVARAVDRAAAGRETGPLRRNRRGARMDRHAATRRLRQLQRHAAVQIARMHTHMLGTPS